MESNVERHTAIHRVVLEEALKVIGRPSGDWSLGCQPLTSIAVAAVAPDTEGHCGPGAIANTWSRRLRLGTWERQRSEDQPNNDHRRQTPKPIDHRTPLRHDNYRRIAEAPGHWEYVSSWGPFGSGFLHSPTPANPAPVQEIG